MKTLKLIKRKLKENFSFTKFTAVFTTLCFVTSVVFSQAVYAAAPVPNIAINLSNMNTTSEIIPFNIGRITDAYYTNSDDIVINIQDLHSHEQTQRNISSILSILDSKFNIADIYLEGASGAVNTSWVSSIKDSTKKQQILNALLKSGKLTGAEYYAIQSKKDVTIKGLEDRTLYSQNFERLNNIFNKQTEVKNYISVLNNLFDEKSKDFYSNENKKLNRILQKYKERKINTDKYVGILLEKAQKANINLSKYPAIINFAKIVSSKKSFNSEKLTSEIKNILNELKDNVSFEEYKNLVEKSAKKEQEIEFYFDLMNLAQKYNILSSKYKNTIAFLEYLSLNQNFNTIELAENENALIKELHIKFAQNKQEEEIFFLKDFLDSLNHYLTNKITAREYNKFMENADTFEFLWKKYIDFDNIIDITEYFSLVEDFYKDNIERNRVFVKNIFKKNPQQQNNVLRIKNSKINHEEKIIESLSKNKKIHIVITGGFHTDGFDKILQDENINYMVITPNITESTAKADELFKNFFMEQKNITTNTFPNRPIGEIINLFVTKGEIANITTDGKKVIIKYVLEEIPDKTINLDEVVSETAADVLTEKEITATKNIILDFQRLYQAIREAPRARKYLNDSEYKTPLIEIQNNITEIEEAINELKESSKSEHIKTITDSFTQQIEKIKKENKETAKLTLPITNKILNILLFFPSKIFKPLRKTSVKNKVKGILASVLEIFAPFMKPQAFVLLHYSKEDRKEIKELKNKIKKIEKEIENINGEITVIKGENKQKNRQIKAIEKQKKINGLRGKQKEALDNDIETLRNEINNNNTEINNKENKINDKKKEIKEQEEEIDKRLKSLDGKETKGKEKTPYERRLAGAKGIVIAAFVLLGIATIALGVVLWIQASSLGIVSVLYFIMKHWFGVLIYLAGSYALGGAIYHSIHNLDAESEERGNLRAAVEELIIKMPKKAAEMFPVIRENIKYDELDELNRTMFDNNVDTIVEFLASVPDKRRSKRKTVRKINEEIDKELSKPDITEEEKEILKNLKESFNDYRYSNLKLNLLEGSVLQKKKSTREIAKDLIAPIRKILQEQALIGNKQTGKKQFARTKYIFLIGGFASGKGTFAEELVVEYDNVLHFSMGKALNNSADTDHPEIRTILDSGKLVPVKITMEIANDVIEKNKTSTIVFDGFPRETEQTKFFEKIRDMGKLDDVIIIYIDVPFEERYKRVEGRINCPAPDCGVSYSLNNAQYAPLEKDGKHYCTKCYNEKGEYIELVQRADDTKEGMKNRDAIFVENTNKLIQIYKTKYGLTVHTVTNSQEGMTVIEDIAASDYNIQYEELLRQTEEDIYTMLKNKILTEDEIKALLSQLAVYLKGKIPATIKNKTINFRTAGVREKMGIFDFDTVALIAQARANIIREAAKSSYRLVNGKNLIREKSDIQKKFFIANDSRFLGKWFSIVEERIFTANGIQCYSVDNPLGTLSTPAISYFLKDLNDGNAEKYGLEPGTIITGSDNITASHNPGDFNGLKPNGIDGAMLSKEETEKISAEIKNIQEKLQRGETAVHVSKKENTILVDGIANAHINYLIETFAKTLGIDENLLYNLRIYNSPKFHLIIDGNHSVLVPEMEALFRYYGFSYEIIRGTDRRDVSFEGKQPEPNKQNMKRLIDKVRNTKIKGKTVFGTASDPDGDRFFVSTQNGEYITPNEIGLIVLDNSLQNILNQMKLDLQAGTLTIEKIKSYQGTILKSHVTSAEIELLAQYYSRLFMEIAFGKDNVNLRTDERTNYVNAYNKGTFIPFAVESYPVGWKNLSGRQKQLESEGKRVIMSLESSGGLSLGLYDKDGGLATVLPFLIAAINGKDFDSMLSEIHKKAGLKSVFKETSVDNLTEEEKASFLSWINEFANYANVNEETKQVYRSTIEVLLKKLALEENLVVKDLVVWENEGIKILLADSNDVGDISTKWITLRISGTEYKTRIMAEAAYDITNSKKSKEKEIDSTLEQYFDIGKEIIGRKGSSSAYKYIQGFITFLQKISKIDGTQIKDISVSSIISETYKALSRQVYLDIVNNIQRETYSFLFEKDTEYTIVAVNGDTKREAEARALASAGIKVNLIYVGENNLTREINTRLEFRVDKKWLAYGLIDNSVKNLTVYGEDNSEQIGNKSFTQQQYLSAILNYINEKSTNTVKILDLPEELSDDINIEEIEEETSNNFTAIGVGKNVFKLFYDAMKNKNKQTSNNFIKLSLAAANVTSDQFSNFGKNDIDRLAQQGITDVILSPFENTDINNFDAMIRTKSNKIRDILFYAHAKGIKITLSFNLSLPENITGEETKKLFTVFVNNLGQRIPTFVDLQKRGLDGIQLDLSQNNVNILMPNMEPFYALAKTVNNTLPIGSFLAIKMPKSLNPGSGYPMLFNYDNVKAVFDYNSPYIEEGISAFGQKGILVNISTDENNSISAEHLARLFENANKKTKENNNRDSISMLSIDSSILKQIDSSEFTFNRMTLINFINSIFGTTPEGQFIKGENKGRTFVSDRDLVFSDEIVKTLCEYVFSDKIDVKNLNEILGAKLKETTSQYELKGFVTGVIQKGEVDRIDSEISFDRTEYSYLLMRALYDYRTTKYEEIFIKNKNSDISEFEKDKDFARGINSYMDPKNVLSNHKFSENIQPEINEILEIFTGKKEGSVDILITRLSKLKDSSALKNNNVDKIAILEALLLLLLNDARLPETDISEKFKETINIKDMNTVMHAMLSAA